MSGLANRVQKPVPSVQEFYFDAVFGTKESQKVVTGMANEVVAAFGTIKTMQDSVLASGRKLLVVLQNSDISYTEEEEHKLIVNLQGMEDDMMELLNILVERENSAICDHKLYGNNEKSVVKVHTIAIKKQKSLIEVTQNIRWEIMSHAEDYDEVVGEATSVDKLIKSLG